MNLLVIRRGNVSFNEASPQNSGIYCQVYYQNKAVSKNAVCIRSQHDNHPLQQQPQRQRDGEENDKSTDVNSVYERSKPDHIYANIVPDEQSNSPEVTSLMTANNAVIYSALEDSGVGTRTVAPSDDLYANVAL